MLAGLSADYYTRLEQGRDHRPSEKVLAALAQALQLDADATAHLFRLAGAVPPSVARPGTTRGRRAGVARPPGRLDHHARPHPRTLAGCPGLQPLARALTPLSEPGTNMLRSVFLNPEVRERSPTPTGPPPPSWPTCAPPSATTPTTLS